MTTITRRQALYAAGTAALAAAAGLPRGAFAMTAEEELVDKCRISVQSMLGQSDFKPMADYIKRARGVLIFPSLFKGGFILGGEGGTGLLLGRRADNSWSYPAFYYFGAASLGLQIGGQLSEVVLTVMNDDSLGRILRNNFKLGADASVAVGPIGKGVGAGTAGGFDSDLYSFSRSAGLFGGVSVDGAIIGDQPERNRYYYGRDVSATQILHENIVSNSQADPLRNALPT